VHLIGHSLGGLLARSLAARRSALVASVVTLGSPFRGVRSHPLVLAASDRVREQVRREDRPDCYTGFCRCEAVTGLATAIPASVPQLAVYTKTDGIVDWRVCVNDDPATDVEVTGTHVALVANPGAYRAIARHLARAPQPTPA
jgi:pimeloyl-ACP methyl ester carboxylesterase